MIAELLFVGTELLLGEILNTNAQYMSQKLALIGVDVYYQTTVGDNPERLAGVLTQALSRADVVITCGGLGPTMDDITRDMVAAVTGRPLETDPAALAELESWFQGRGAQMTANNARQAMVPQGATVLTNDRGTAPGLIVPAEGARSVILLPGPPNEFRPMFDNQVIPYLTSRMGGRPLTLVSRTLRFIDIGESAMENALADLIMAQQDPNIAPYAKLGECHLRLSTKAPDAETGLAKIEPVEAEIRRRLGEYLYSAENESLEEAVGRLLRERGLWLTVAESCTGGLLGARITDVPGSSDYFATGYLTYSNEAKMSLLGLPAEILAAHGAVSAETVKAMAEGALARSGASVAVAISGVAGPGGGTETKPVGTVYLGLAGRPAGDLPGGTWARKLQLWGSRQDVRSRSATAALAMVRRYLLGQQP